MRFKVGAKIVVKNVHNGGNFENGDVVSVAQIGCEDDPNCYGAISPYDGLMWYCRECESLHLIENGGKLKFESCVPGWLNWLRQPAVEE